MSQFTHEKVWWVQKDHAEPNYPDMWRSLSSFDTREEAEVEAAWLCRRVGPEVSVRVIHVPRYGSVEAYRAAQLAAERAVAS